MKLSSQSISHIQTLTHDGKVLIVGTAPDGVLYYSVKRSGYEQSALADAASPLGFEPWRPLRTGESADDPSVAAYEADALTATSADGSALLRSRYGAGNETTRSADAPVQLLSALGYVYVFRQSPSGKILVSRFVLDGMTNELVPRLEVRFRRSKKRMAPDPRMAKKGASLENVDSVDYRDMDNKSFYEPATELSFLGTVANGWFTVTLVPTGESGTSRWHFVVHDQAVQKLVAYSVVASEGGLFDVTDTLYGGPDPARKGAVVYRTIPGILKRTLDLQGAAVAGCPAMTTYDLQREQALDDGTKQLLRDAVRVMLTVPVRRSGESDVKVAALSFGLAADGTMSQVDETPDTSALLRSKVRDLMLPLDVLDGIKEIAATAPPPSGKILACERGAGDQLQIRSQESLPPAFAAGSSVQIRGTQSYNGHYKVVAVDGNRFTVEAAFINNEPGFWEVIPEKDTGLVFDNMIVGYQKSADNKLQVLCSAHDLKVGDEVQIAGTRASDGVVTVLSVDAANKAIVLDTPYFTGEAANLSTVSRRGLVMNGGADKVVTPSLGLDPSRSDRPWARTLQTWLRVDALGATERRLIADSGGVTRLLIDTSGKGRFEVRMADGSLQAVTDTTVMAVNAWIHYAGSASYDPSTGKTTLKLSRNGAEIGSLVVSSFPRSADGPTHLKGLPLAFDGADDHVLLPPLTVDYSKGLTLEAWARVDDLAGSYTRLFDLGNGAGVDNILLAREATSTRLCFAAFTGNSNPGQPASPDGTCEVGRWIHYAVTLSSAGAITFYKNGVQIGAGTGGAPPSVTRTKCYLGRSNWAENALFKGAMADARIWSRVRTAAEIQADMRRMLGGNEPGLVACWPLDDGTGRELTGKYTAALAGSPARSAAVPAADAFTIGEATAGEMADAQVWTAARPAADIKATMHLPLTGNEPDLAGYYRLGALLYGDTVSAPDLAAGRHDAQVFGEPYAGARRCNRATKSGAKVVKFGNDALVAVSQRATYEESFEFKVNAPGAIDVNNADGAGMKLFSLKYWGKRGRNSDAQIPFPAGSFQQQDFASLGGGWYKVTCRFTVPSGVSVLRAFEMGDVRGRWGAEAAPPATEWTSIDVRKHRIRELSDLTTREAYTDVITLAQLSATGPSLSSVLSAEADVQARRAEVRDLLQRLDVAQNAARYQAEKSALQSTIIPALNAEKAALNGEIAAIEADLTSYYWKIQTLWYNKKLQPRFGSTAQHTCTGIGSDIDQRYQQWSFENADGGTYKIRNRAADMVLELADTYVVDGTDIWLAPVSAAAQQKWKLIVAGTQGSDTVYYIGNLLGNVMNVWGGDTNESAWVKMFWQSDSWNMKFILQKVEMLAAKADLIKAKRDKIAEIDGKIQVRNTRLSELTALLAQNETVASVQALLATARTNLNSATASGSALITGNTTYLSGLAALPPITMPAVAVDKRGLVTQGAVLDFVRPFGRVSVAETCDGNVQLTYVDSLGRLCQTAYDAAADSRNSAFDQWVPPPGRAGATFGSSGSMALAAPVSLPQGNFTFETWFQFPLAFKDDGTTVSYHALSAFASDAAGNNVPLAVAGGDRLGLVADGMFHDSGARLSNQIAPGWHHAAVVTRESSADFYLDGVKVGSAARSFRGLKLNGTTDYVSVPAFAWPASGFTVSIWARSATASWNSSGILMTKRDSFIIHPVINTRQVQWYIFTTGWTCVSFTPDDIQGWHLYTGTYDGSTLCLYIDGKLVASAAITGAAGASGTTPLTFGRDPINTYFNGQVAEPAVWNRVLSAPEIEDLLRSDPRTDDANLIGLWSFGAQGATVKDRSSQKRDATIVGAPATVEIKPVCTGALTCIGNLPAGGRPAGRMAEVRLWNAALTGDEVAADSRSALTGNEPGLLHCWPLSEGTGTAARDIAADGQVHGKVASTAWIAGTLPLGGAVTSVMSFDGRSAYIDVPSASLPASGAALTLSCYVRCTGGRGARRAVISFRGFSLTMEATNQWSAQIRTGASAQDGVSGAGAVTGEWVHLAATYNGAAVTLYINGASVATKNVVYSASAGVPLRIGADVGASNAATSYLTGQVGWVSVFNRALSPAEIAGLTRPLRGDEPGLYGAWPLDDAYKTGMTVRDLGPARLAGTVANAWPVKTFDLPANKGAEVSLGEYSTVAPARDGANQAIMRRFIAAANGGDVEVMPDLRVEELALQWIGNMQMSPTLLGYIEGAPPVPSENLTVESDYRNATSVTLRQSEDVTYRWDRSEDGETSFDMSGFAGGGWSVEGGMGIVTKITEGSVGAVFNYSNRKSASRASSVSASSSLQMSDTLALRGALESRPRFPRLGARYVPKNVGYALVVSGLADVFITKLKRTGRMVSYEIRPVEGIPLDVNTITFMINPAYTLNGSLDGQVGSSAADERFYGHVPAMRAQYGALYPASYYRLKEAYDLKLRIEQKDKDRESYFANYDVSSSAFMDIQEADASSAQAAVGPSVQAGAAGGQAAVGQVAAQAEEQKKQAASESQRRKDEITSKYTSLDTRVRASGAFDDWQKRMERLQIRAGKRNIVNTYVWDGDGGLRAESETFASTIEHSIGSGTSDAGGAGFESDILVSGFKSRLSLMGGGSSSSTQRKSLSTTKTVELTVDLSGVESTGITDLADRPVLPGEKVDRYRFMTFFLEGATDHFHHFFNRVVDPEWLAGSDEEARALRQTQAGRPNACWRVMHRVTYIERPALAGSGGDARLPADAAPATGSDVVSSYFDQLSARHQQLVGRLGALEGNVAQILALLTAPKV